MQRLDPGCNFELIILLEFLVSLEDIIRPNDPEQHEACKMLRKFLLSDELNTEIMNLFRDRILGNHGLGPVVKKMIYFICISKNWIRKTDRIPLDLRQRILTADFQGVEKIFKESSLGMTYFLTIKTILEQMDRTWEHGAFSNFIAKLETLIPIKLLQVKDNTGNVERKFGELHEMAIQIDGKLGQADTDYIEPLKDWFLMIQNGPVSPENRFEYLLKAVQGVHERVQGVHERVQGRNLEGGDQRVIAPRRESIFVEQGVCSCIRENQHCDIL